MSNYSIHVNSILLLIPIPVCIDISIVSGITVISSYMYNYIYMIITVITILIILLRMNLSTLYIEFLIFYANTCIIILCMFICSYVMRDAYNINMIQI